MGKDDTDDLVPFPNVRVIRSTGPALLCMVRNQRVWLLRSQVSGRLRRTGDRGRLLIRRTVASDRGLIQPGAKAVLPPLRSVSRRRSLGQLHLVRGDEGRPLAN
jgi:hypothetical protein